MLGVPRQLRPAGRQRDPVAAGGAPRRPGPVPAPPPPARDAHRPGAGRGPLRGRGRRPAGRPPGRRDPRRVDPGPRRGRGGPAAGGRGRAVPQPAAGAAGTGRGRRRPAPDQPIFLAPRAGVGRLVDVLVEALAGSGSPVRDPGGESVHGRPGRRGPRRPGSRPVRRRGDRHPGPGSGGRLGAAVAGDPDQPGTLAGIPTASVALVTVALPGTRLPPGVNGFLVPAGVGPLMTACSFASNKWPHWAEPGRGPGPHVGGTVRRPPGPRARRRHLDRPAAGRAGDGPRRRPLAGGGAGLPLARRLPAVPSGPRRPDRRGGSRPRRSPPGGGPGRRLLPGIRDSGVHRLRAPGRPTGARSGRARRPPAATGIDAPNSLRQVVARPSGPGLRSPASEPPERPVIPPARARA